VCVCVGAGLCVFVCTCVRARAFLYYRYCVQVPEATVTIDAIRAAFTTLNISKLANASVGYLVDSGYEEAVPVANLVSLLRGSGLDAPTALDVKKVALMNPSLTRELVC
jgi:hypothetical protein